MLLQVDPGVDTLLRRTLASNCGFQDKVRLSKPIIEAKVFTQLSRNTRLLIGGELFGSDHLSLGLKADDGVQTFTNELLKPFLGGSSLIVYGTFVLYFTLDYICFYYCHKNTARVFDKDALNQFLEHCFIVVQVVVPELFPRKIVSVYLRLCPCLVLFQYMVCISYYP